MWIWILGVVGVVIILFIIKNIISFGFKVIGIILILGLIAFGTWFYFIKPNVSNFLPTNTMEIQNKN